jgi:hypothetical protein
MRPWSILVSFILLAGCVREKPPHPPIVGGPDRAQPGETLRLQARTSDPNGDNIAYIFDWGDGSPPEISPEISSGDTMFMYHSYPESGVYPVVVTARDEKGNQSAPSSPFSVEINFFGPLTPSLPIGPPVAYPDTPLVFTTFVRHRFDQPVAVQFDFGDSLSPWTGFYPSGCTVSLTRRFQHRGRFSVRARAKDQTGAISPWSAPAPVLIDFPPLGPPENLRLAARLGIFVRLRWSPGRNHDSVAYAVWFRQADSSQFQLVAITTDSSLVHDPLSTTGDYTVSARFRDAEVFARETVSTIPVFTDTLLLAELNATGAAGYGWDSITFTGLTLSMRDSSAAGLCRCYLTNFSPDSLSLNYFLASARLGPEDPGNVVPPGNWRRIWLANITGNSNAPLPAFDTLTYRDRVLLGTSVTEIAGYLPEGNYALLRVFPAAGCRFRLVSWYQPVKDLRLIYPQGGKK